MLRLFRHGSLCRPLQICIKIVTIRLPLRQKGSQTANIINREIQPVAGQHPVVQNPGPINRLRVIENSLIKEIILRHSGIFPVHRRLPAETATKDAQQHCRIQ